MTKQFALHQHPIKFEYANCCQFESFHFDSTAKDVTCGQVNATRSADEKQKTNQRPSRRIRSNRWRVPHSNRWVPTGEPPTGETPCSLQSFDTRRIFARGAPTFLMIHLIASGKSSRRYKAGRQLSAFNRRTIYNLPLSRSVQWPNYSAQSQSICWFWSKLSRFLFLGQFGPTEIGKIRNVRSERNAPTSSTSSNCSEFFVGRNDRPAGMCWFLPLFLRRSQLAPVEMEANIPTGKFRNAEECELNLRYLEL